MAANNYFDTSRNTQEALLETERQKCASRDRAKSIFSIVMVCLAVVAVLFWVACYVYWFADGEVTWENAGQGAWVFPFSFLFFFCIGGFPWGWSIFWPFWRDHLYGVNFNVLHFYGILCIISILLDLAFFIAKWTLLVGLSLGFGWISMLIHIPTIFRSLRRSHPSGRKAEKHNAEPQSAA